MSRYYTSDCVDCGLPCLGSGCPYYRVAVDVCDNCGAEDAEYRLDGDDMCEYCVKAELESRFNELNQQEKEKALEVTAAQLLKEVFDDLTMSEKAEALDMCLHKIDDQR